MKVLMLTPYLPYPLMSGGQTRSYNLIKNLSSKHEITLFSLITGEEEKKYVKELMKYCRKVMVFRRSKTPWTIGNILRTGFGLYPFLVIRNLSSEEKRAVKDELSREKYDLIHAETFYAMPHIPQTKVPILLVEQTVEYLVYKHYVEELAPLLLRPLLSFDVLKLKYWETFFWKQAKRAVAVSDSDRKEMKKLVNEIRIDVVPNGIDNEYFSEKPRNPGLLPKVLYVGNFKWLQNVEAIELLVKKVWPEIKKQSPKARLWIVGKNITDKVRSLQSPDVEITEGIPDIRDAYSKSSVLVAPIKGPGGTRLKILEAMASGLPVVTTSVGAEGLNLVNGKEAFISDDLTKIASLAVKIIKDKNLSRELGRAGKAFVEKKYTWAKSSALLNNIYDEIAINK